MTGRIIKDVRTSICGATAVGLLMLLLAAGCSDSGEGDTGDDHSNTPDRATLVTLAPDNDNPQIATAILSGELEERGDSDVFRIELADVRTLDVESMGDTDTEGRLLRLFNGMKDYLTVEKLDDISSSNLNFTFTRRQLNAGIYFIEVSSFNRFERGDYRLRVRVITDDYPDMIELAIDPVPLDMTLESGLEWENGRGGDIDVFRIELAQAAVLRFDMSSSSETVGTLLDSIGKPISEFFGNSHGSRSAIESLPAGTYFVKVRGAAFTDTGPYEFTASVLPDVSDDRPDTIDLAINPVPFDVPIGADLEMAFDFDIFRIELPNADLLRVGLLRVGTSTSTSLRLFDMSGLQQLGNKSFAVDRDFRSLIGAFLPAGTYFAEVRGSPFTGTGPYELTARVQPDVPDDRPDRIDLAIDPVLFDVPIEADLEVAFDVDVFRIEFPKAGLLRVDTSGASAVHTLLDIMGNPISEDPIKNTFPVTKPLFAGTYFVAVRGFAFIETGPYEFTASVLPDVPDDRPDRIDLAINPVPFDVPIESDLEVAFDFDIFRIELPNAGTLTVSASGSTDTFGTLIDIMGNPISEDGDSGVFRNFLITKLLPAGTYFVEVKGFDSPNIIDTGPYEFTASLGL